MSLKISEIKKKKKINYSSTTKHKGYRFYDLPKYYDIAFKRDIINDFKFFERVFQLYSDFNVKNVLEPACGTGIIMEEFSNHGYNTLGYDKSKAMINYCKQWNRYIKFYF